MPIPKIDLLEFLHDNVKPAAGCTEVGAIGYAAAYVSDILRNKMNIGSAKDINLEKITAIDLTLDMNIYKNAHSVTVPNSKGSKGPVISAALGLVLDIASSHPLSIFEQVDDDALDAASRIKDKVHITIDKSRPSPYIRFSLSYGPHIVTTTISGAHDRVTEATFDGKVSHAANACLDIAQKNYGLVSLTFDQLLEVVGSISEKEEEMLQQTKKLNLALVEDGLSHSYGFGLVDVIKKLKLKGYFSDDLFTDVKLSVAAAVEARMGGSPLSAMSSSGSGNMGLTATIPIIIAGKRLNKPERRILESVLLSHIVVHLASERVGKLSALCGASNKSSLGAAAGIAYLLEGSSKTIQCSINAVASNVIGSICDGAKYNCTLKAMSSASIALECALFCTYGMPVDAGGIVDDSVFSTLDNLSKIAHSFATTDDVIVSILEDRDQDANNF